MYFLSNVRTFCIKSFTDGVRFGTENSRTQGCPSLPNLQFFFTLFKRGVGSKRLFKGKVV